MSNGFTKMDNDFLEMLYQKGSNLTRADMCVMLCIYRHTIGYHRESCKMTGVELAKKTGFSRVEIVNATKRLDARGLLEVTKAVGSNSGIYYKIGELEDTQSVNPGIRDFSDLSVQFTEGESTDCNLSKPELTGDENYTSPPTLYKENIKEKKRYVCKDIGTHAPSFIPDWFNDIWKEYPQQIGKGKLTKEDYEALSRYSYDEMHRAIERYKRDKEEKDIDYWQNGSTFFKTGYVDFLDENYIGEPLPDEKPKERRYER